MNIDLQEIYNEGQKEWFLLEIDFKREIPIWIQNIKTEWIEYISLETLLLDLKNKYGFMDTIFKNAEVKKAFWGQMCKDGNAVNLDMVNDKYNYGWFECEECGQETTTPFKEEMLMFYKIKWCANQLKRGDV